MTAQITTLGAEELFNRLNEDPLRVYQAGADELQKRGFDDAPTVSRVLEHLSPSDPNDQVDAFERMLKLAGIRTTSNPAAGYWASKASQFFDGGRASRFLYTEFFARQWRQVVFGGQRGSSVLLSSDGVPGSWQRPYADAATPRWSQQIAPAIPLSEVVAMTSPIEGQDYRAFYLTTSAAALRKFRTGESAEIPIATLTDYERTITLRKYGRGVRATYEQLRRMRVDKLAMYIRFAALQSESDKVAAAIDALVNGAPSDDTNADPASHNLTTLDADATAGTLTLKGWLSFKMKFTNPYMITTGFMQEAVALQLALLNTGSGNTPLSMVNLAGLGTNLVPINQFADGVRYGWTSDAPSLKIVGIDRRFALENVVEIGGTIDEMERFITNQTQVMMMTEIHGFATLDNNAVKILDVNA